MTTPEVTPKMSSNENVYIHLIEQSLEGVMFHNYNIDVFDLLNLKGFKKLHYNQYKEENENLHEIKHMYIREFHKMPILSIKTTNFWNTSFDNVSEETLPELTKQALKAYYDWESGVLNNLLNWRKDAEDKKMFQEKIKDVMSEIERLETLMNVLDKHDYDYDCICELSNYLYSC